ncbi:glycosyltransferase family 4 protein [Cohnella fermenti]|uniref:Glycosyltransferase family 4 protein n=1 Tax=Cohnella fermenti TaxID=2565925 RepID=A0A4S4BGB0_9BACL|nr:glycosyltransferase family 4 protein [Cohnella fermenti]THF73349.1 glycosyltransferase family 4 protein [Cohnella fermenti]
MHKVAFVTPGAYPVPSPNGGSVERVVEKLVPLLQPAIEARIFGRGGARLRPLGRLNGVVCERLPMASRGAYMNRVVRRLRAWRPDLIEVENRPKTILRLRREFPRANLWLHLHSNTFLLRPYLNDKRTLLASVRAADRIIVNSRFLREFVVRQAPEAAGKIGIVHPGVEPERFLLPHREVGRAQRGWCDRRIVLYMGRLIPLKGVHHLLKALPELVRRVPNVLVVIVGSPFYGSGRMTEYSRKLRRMAKPYAAHVHFQSYVPYDEVPEWYALADVAVVPSVRREAFGLVNVEAMAAGLPVVATRIGGMPEIVQDGNTGFLIDAANAPAELADRLSLLLANEALRAEMGRRGQARVCEQFMWQHSAAGWLREWNGFWGGGR